VNGYKRFFPGTGKSRNSTRSDSRYARIRNKIAIFYRNYIDSVALSLTILLRTSKRFVEGVFDEQIHK